MKTSIFTGNKYVLVISVVERVEQGMRSWGEYGDFEVSYTDRYCSGEVLVKSLKDETEKKFKFHTGSSCNYSQLVPEILKFNKRIVLDPKKMIDWKVKQIINGKVPLQPCISDIYLLQKSKKENEEELLNLGIIGDCEFDTRQKFFQFS